MMKIRKIRLGIFILAAGCLLSGCENALEDGTDLLRKGDYQEAITVFEQITEGNKSKGNVAEAYRGIGIAYYELEEYETAGSNLQKALEEGGTETPTIYHLIGVCAMHLGDYDGALAAFEKGTALYQDTVPSEGTEQQADDQAALQEMLRNRVICYEKKQDWENTKAAIADYAARYPEDAEAQKEAEFWATR